MWLIAYLKSVPVTSALGCESALQVLAGPRLRKATHEINGPNTSSRPDIKHFMNTVWERGQMELSAKGHHPHLVLLI